MTDWPLPSLTELPTALIELILAKLDPQGLCNVSRTCSHLFRLASKRHSIYCFSQYEYG